MRLVCWLLAFQMVAQHLVRRVEPAAVPMASFVASHGCVESARSAEAPAAMPGV